MARVTIRPLIGTSVTPNHLTTARLVIGVLACFGFMVNSPIWSLWSGILWLISCFLDYADGELARLSGLSSASGHTYDYFCDVFVNSFLFVAVGINLTDSPMGNWSILLGLIAGISIAIASVFSEWLEEESDNSTKAYSGIFGFDFDTLLFLVAPAAWMGLFSYILIGAAIAGPFFAILTGFRILKQRPRSS